LRVGIDIVKISRIKHAITRASFSRKVFTDAELDISGGLPVELQATFFAGRFAAKEATVKALGTGFSKGIDMQQIEVLKDASGRPRLFLYGKAKELAELNSLLQWDVSISHESNLAVATVILL